MEMKRTSFCMEEAYDRGNPISPMLFILAGDVFQRLVAGTNSTLLNPLSARYSDSILALQYADDTAIIANAHQETLISLKLILRIFAKCSVLQINFGKSSFIPFNLDLEQITNAGRILGFSQASLPVIYLGMPLTIKSPPRRVFLPLIEKIENRMEGWKGELISRGGRLQLAKSVLSAIPIYFMTCFQLPVWVLKRIDCIRRTFLWGNNSDGKKGISLINWRMATNAGGMGGYGLHDL